ncbi:hypothetical protein BGZ72_001215 [Mortierella alpina]|nr:hypothetical protein BGZ72_001215 [Mortierella alpina]
MMLLLHNTKGKSLKTKSNGLMSYDGETLSRAFSVKISADETVDEFKELIKAKKSPRFDDVAADELTLWKFNLPIVPENNHKPIVLNEIDSKAELLPINDLYDVFEEKPLRNTIRILVQRPLPVAKDMDAIAKFTVTINGVTPKTFEWITTPKTAILDHLRKVIL